MNLELKLRKNDFYIEKVESFDTNNYLEAIKMALDKYNKQGYALASVKNLDPESSFNISENKNEV